MKSENSPNPGTQLNIEVPSSLLFNKEKEEKLKKSLYIKFWIALLLTNIFTYILSIPAPTTIVSNEITIGQEESLLKLKINEMTNTVGMDKFVSLYSGSNQITNKAKILKRLESDESSIYLVKIPISELNKIEPYKTFELDSYPVTNRAVINGGAYEIEI